MVLSFLTRIKYLHHIQSSHIFKMYFLSFLMSLSITADIAKLSPQQANKHSGEDNGKCLHREGHPFLLIPRKISSLDFDELTAILEYFQFQEKEAWKKSLQVYLCEIILFLIYSFTGCCSASLPRQDHRTT